MLFNKETILFNINSVPVIGNFDTGSLIGLTESGKAFCDKIINSGIETENVEPENLELFQALCQAGFFEEICVNKSLSAYLHVTQRCNLHCVGCYSLDSDRNCLKDPSTEQVKRAISQLAQNGCQLLVISGGEPFLRKDLGEILQYAKNEAQISRVQIITNGTFLTIEMLQQVKPYVDGIAVSIDGYSKKNPTFIRDEGIFDKVISAVKLTKKAGIDTTILPTIHTKNSDVMMEYVKLSKKLKVGISYSLLTCSPKDSVLKEWLPTNKQLSRIAEELIEIGLDGAIAVNDMPIGDGLDTRKSCEVGCKIVSVGADGTVYPCHMLHDRRLAMGNVFEENLSDIMTTDIAITCKNLHVDNFDVCNKCKHRYICGGGCRARSFYVYDNLTSHDFYCPMTKTYFDWISDQLEKMYKQ